MAVAWRLIYYMPYANDLSACAGSIKSAFQDGFRLGSCDHGRPSSLSSLTLYLQVKSRADPSSMMREVWQSEVGVEGSKSYSHRNLGKVPDSSDSSSHSVLNDFLSWVLALDDKENGKKGENDGELSPSIKYAFVILGHGGGVHEVSPDETAGTRTCAAEKGKATKEEEEEVVVGKSTNWSWMNISEVARAMYTFQAKTGGGLKFIYLQNCCKSSFNSLIPFRQLGVHVLASQTILGAPNEYYCEFIRYLFTNPSEDALSLCNKICDFESPLYFAVLCCFNTKVMEKCCNSMEVFFSSVVEFWGNSQNIVTSETSNSASFIASFLSKLSEFYIPYQANGLIDRYIDLMGLCRTLTSLDSYQAGSDKNYAGSQLFSIMEANFNEFSAIFNEFARSLKISPKAMGYSHMCGISLYFPFGGGADYCANNLKAPVTYPFSDLSDYSEDKIECQRDLFAQVPSLSQFFRFFIPREHANRTRFHDARTALLTLSQQSGGGSISSITTNIPVETAGRPEPTSTVALAVSSSSTTKWVPSWKRAGLSKPPNYDEKTELPPDMNEK